MTRKRSQVQILPCSPPCRFFSIIMGEVLIRVGDYSNQFPKGTTVKEVLEASGKRGPFVAAEVDGALVDFWYEINEDSTVEPLAPDSPGGLHAIRHTTAHVMAEAVQSLYPEARVTIGPVIENGFFYDFDYPPGFTPEDLEKIEGKMREIIAEDKPLVRRKVSRAEAEAIFSREGEGFKVEILRDIPEEEDVTIYYQGEWHDLCRGPHAPSTGAIKAFKLLSIAGAYWRGDERNPMLQRIYGTSFANPKELRVYLHNLEEARKRDHRKLGKELDLYSIQEEVGAGLVLWHPKGSRIRRIIEDLWRDEHERAGYDLLFTPHVAHIDLWKTSGHLDFYREYMFSPMDYENTEYQLKPMNCPFHCMIYKTQVRSYRELPIRWAEIGSVYRHERSGVLHGLLRVRGFTQDDAHIFCRPDQIESEVEGVIDLTIRILGTFGFDDYEVFVSTRPEKFVGDEEGWERAQVALESALKNKGLDYSIEEGGGAFYGPKIDLKIKDVLGRAWQCSTIQVDFNLPERFGLAYVGEDNARHAPIMIHRAIYGSFERFFGILIEHFGGAFPLWLSPVQVRVASISDAHVPFARGVVEELKEGGLRVEEDFRNEKLGLKVREAQMEKIPYLLVIGEKEVGSKTVSPRVRGGKNLPAMGVKEFLSKIGPENDRRKWREVPKQ